MALQKVLIVNKTYPVAGLELLRKKWVLKYKLTRSPKREFYLAWLTIGSCSNFLNKILFNRALTNMECDCEVVRHYNRLTRGSVKAVGCVVREPASGAPRATSGLAGWQLIPWLGRVVLAFLLTESATDAHWRPHVYSHYHRADRRDILPWPAVGLVIPS